MTNSSGMILGLAFGIALGVAAAEVASTSTKTNAAPVIRGKTIEMPADIASVPALDLQIGDDPMKRYFLIGLPTNAPPTAGPYRLLLVLPGGDGSADFTPFVRRIYKNALNDRWLIAQLVAPMWDHQQKQMVVWPSRAVPYANAKFTTEAFADAVMADVKKRAPVKTNQVFALAWSSGGPAVYAMAARDDSPLSGAFVAMSVFLRGEHAAISSVKGKSFYLLQSPDDRITRFDQAEKARDALAAAGARVHLQSYAGGHGWRGPVWPMMREGIKWLENDK
jgi:predicted esterase